jgi:hypothetical protein
LPPLPPVYATVQWRSRPSGALLAKWYAMPGTVLSELRWLRRCSRRSKIATKAGDGWQCGALGPAAPGDNEMVGALLAALKVDDRLRDDAAWALGPAAASGNPSVVAALLAVLKDDSPFASFVRRCRRWVWRRLATTR